jgi:hypothetical protein
MGKKGRMKIFLNLKRGDQENHENKYYYRLKRWEIKYCS